MPSKNGTTIGQTSFVCLDSLSNLLSESFENIYYGLTSMAVFQDGVQERNKLLAILACSLEEAELFEATDGY